MVHNGFLCSYHLILHRYSNTSIDRKIMVSHSFGYYIFIVEQFVNNTEVENELGTGVKILLC